MHLQNILLSPQIIFKSREAPSSRVPPLMTNTGCDAVALHVDKRSWNFSVLNRKSSFRGSIYSFFLCWTNWIVDFCKRHYLKFFLSDLHINEEKWVALYVVIVLSKMCFVLILHINYKKKANLYVDLIIWWMRFSCELHIRYGKTGDL